MNKLKRAATKITSKKNEEHRMMVAMAKTALAQDHLASYDVWLEEKGSYTAWELSFDAENHQALVIGGFIPKLRDCLKALKLNARANSAGALRCLSCNALYREVLLQEKVMESMIDLAYKTAHAFEGRYDPATGTSYLAEGDELVKLPEGSISIPRHLGNDLDQQKSMDMFVTSTEEMVLATLTHLCESDNGRSLFEDLQGVKPSCLLLLRAGNDHVLQKALQLMCTISEEQRLREPIVDMGVQKVYLEVIAMEDLHMRALGLAAFSFTSLPCDPLMNIDLARPMGKNGACKAIIEVVRYALGELKFNHPPAPPAANAPPLRADDPQNPKNWRPKWGEDDAQQLFDILEFGSTTLWNLASDSGNRHDIAEAGGVALLIELTTCDNPSAVFSAAGTFAAMAVEHSLKQIMVAQGVTPPLVTLLSSENLQVQEYAVSALCMLATDVENRQELVDCGVLPPLIDCIRQSDQSPLMAEYSAATAASLTSLETVCHQIRDLDGLGPIIALVQGSHMQHLVYALLCLWNLGFYAENRTAIRELNGVHKCVQAAKEYVINVPDNQKGTTAVKLKQYVSGALWSLCFDDQTKLIVNQEGGLEPLIDFADSSNLGLQELAVGALWTLADHHENKEKIVACGALDPLFTIMQTESLRLSMTGCFAAGCLKSLSANAQNRGKISDLGGDSMITNLIQLCDAVSEPAQYEGVSALASLSVPTMNKVNMAVLGTIDKLVEVLQDEDRSARVHVKAAMSLLNLSVCVRNQVSVLMGYYRDNFATSGNSTACKGRPLEAEKVRPTDPSKQEVPRGLNILVHRAMHSEHRCVRDYCSRALTNCATHPANRTRIYRAELALKGHFHKIIAGYPDTNTPLPTGAFSPRAEAEAERAANPPTPEEVEEDGEGGEEGEEGGDGDGGSPAAAVPEEAPEKKDDKDDGDSGSEDEVDARREFVSWIQEECAPQKVRTLRGLKETAGPGALRNISLKDRHSLSYYAMMDNKPSPEELAAMAHHQHAKHHHHHHHGAKHPTAHDSGGAGSKYSTKKKDEGPKHMPYGGPAWDDKKTACPPTSNAMTGGFNSHMDTMKVFESSLGGASNTNSPRGGNWGPGGGVSLNSPRMPKMNRAMAGTLQSAWVPSNTRKHVRVVNGSPRKMPTPRGQSKESRMLVELRNPRWKMPVESVTTPRPAGAEGGAGGTPDGASAGEGGAGGTPDAGGAQGSPPGSPVKGGSDEAAAGAAAAPAEGAAEGEGGEGAPEGAVVGMDDSDHNRINVSVSIHPASDGNIFKFTPTAMPKDGASSYLASFEHVKGSRALANSGMATVSWPDGSERYLYHRKTTGEVEPLEEETKVPDPPPQDPPLPPTAVLPKLVRNDEVARPNAGAQGVIDPLRNRFYNCPQGSTLLFVLFMDDKEMSPHMAKKHSPEDIAAADASGRTLEPHKTPTFFEHSCDALIKLAEDWLLPYGIKFNVMAGNKLAPLWQMGGAVAGDQLIKNAKEEEKLALDELKLYLSMVKVGGFEKWKEVLDIVFEKHHHGYDQVFLVSNFRAVGDQSVMNDEVAGLLAEHEEKRKAEEKPPLYFEFVGLGGDDKGLEGGACECLRVMAQKCNHSYRAIDEYGDETKWDDFRGHRQLVPQNEPEKPRPPTPEFYPDEPEKDEEGVEKEMTAEEKKKFEEGIEEARAKFDEEAEKRKEEEAANAKNKPLSLQDQIKSGALKCEGQYMERQGKDMKEMIIPMFFGTDDEFLDKMVKSADSCVRLLPNRAIDWDRPTGQYHKLSLKDFSCRLYVDVAWDHDVISHFVVHAPRLSSRLPLVIQFPYDVPGVQVMVKPLVEVDSDAPPVDPGVPVDEPEEPVPLAQNRVYRNDIDSFTLFVNPGESYIVTQLTIDGSEIVFDHDNNQEPEVPKKKHHDD